MEGRADLHGRNGPGRDAAAGARRVRPLLHVDVSRRALRRCRSRRGPNGLRIRCRAARAHRRRRSHLVEVVVAAPRRCGGQTDRRRRDERQQERAAHVGAPMGRHDAGRAKRLSLTATVRTATPSWLARVLLERVIYSPIRSPGALCVARSRGGRVPSRWYEQLRLAGGRIGARRDSGNPGACMLHVCHACRASCE